MRQSVFANSSNHAEKPRGIKLGRGFSPVHSGLEHAVGPVGLTMDPVSIIRTVQYVELIEYFMCVKNHVDRIAVVL